MPAPDLPYLLGEVRRLTERYKAGGRDAFGGFHELTILLLSNTVLHWFGGVVLSTGPRANTMQLGGWAGPTDPFRLKDDRFLRMGITLFLDAATNRLKVEAASFQYQMTREHTTWIFRYDYLRTPPDPEPAAHLQIRGNLAEACLPPGRQLQDIHFPTGRVSIEGVIRLLVEGFKVPCEDWQERWRPALAESERAFLDIAHRPLSGPAS